MRRHHHCTYVRTRLREIDYYSCWWCAEAGADGCGGGRCVVGSTSGVLIGHTGADPRRDRAPNWLHRSSSTTHTRRLYSTGSTHTLTLVCRAFLNALTPFIKLQLDLVTRKAHWLRTFSPRCGEASKRCTARRMQCIVQQQQWTECHCYPSRPF